MQVEVFVSYAREDELLAQSIVNQLENEGLLVWWDKKITHNSKNFRIDTEKALSDAKSVLVIWTKDSVNSTWVLDEADMALSDGKLIQLCNVNEVKKPPLGFKSHQYIPIEVINTQEKQLSVDSYKVVLEAIRQTIGIRSPLEHIIHPSMLGPALSFGGYGFRYYVPGMALFLSFFPSDDSGVFLSMRLDTTDGWITTDKWENEESKRYVESRKKRADFEHPEVEYEDGGNKYFKVSDDIYLIKDPIRPYTIQIGKLRSMRPSAEPGMIDGKITDGDLDHLPLHKPWLSKTLAEIISDPVTLLKLSQIIEKEPRLSDKEKKEIHNTIARNPNASLEIQQRICLFCNETFKKARRLSDNAEEEAHGAFIVANDFPFGPYFHYLAITSKPVHSWEELSYKQMKGLNQIVYRFLQDKKNIRGAAGIGFGFNSTIRHLVLGAHSHSSAGASIPHIHKQVWGMAPGTSNLANQLIEVSQAYENHGVDYQGTYLKALEKAGYVIWQDDYVKLYVPYGQSSKFELQAMACSPCGAFTDLSEDEVMSLSKAEYVALRLFKELKINSFNHVMLSKLFNDKRAPRFRLVELFITREVDLAVSELSSLYVVDQHPWDSRNKIMEQWEKIKGEVLEEMGK